MKNRCASRHPWNTGLPRAYSMRSLRKGGGLPLGFTWSLRLIIARSISGGMVPGSGLIRTLGVETTDPYVRMKDSFDDYIRSGIPGLSQELEPLRNVPGEPINRPANSLGEAV